MRMERVGTALPTYLEHPSFLIGCAVHLPPQFREKYRDQPLAHGKRSTCQGLVDFVQHPARVAESEPEAWKDKTLTKKTDNNSNHSDTKYLPCVSYTSNNNQHFTSINNSNNSNTQWAPIDCSDWICPYCQQKGHTLWKYLTYMALSLQDRKTFFMEQQRCTNCSSNGMDWLSARTRTLAIHVMLNIIAQQNPSEQHASLEQ